VGGKYISDNSEHGEGTATPLGKGRAGQDTGDDRDCKVRKFRFDGKRAIGKESGEIIPFVP